MHYRIELKPSAARQLEKLPKAVQIKIGPRIDALSENPRPHGVEKLAGAEDYFRIRVGDYRVIYQVQDRWLLILVVRLGHRREIYRGF